MSQLLIDSSSADGETTLRIQGDVDSGSVGELREALARVGTNGPMVIDLAGVPFIDSSGLGTLVRASRAAQANGSSFRVVNAGRAVARAAEYAGLSEHLGLTTA